jgi:GT2 family glycosyltransferase
VESEEDHPNADKPKVSVVVVSFNSERTIAKCVESVPDDCEVVLVDQSSTDQSIATALMHRPSLTLVRGGTNRGFGTGCNLGAANARGDVLIFLNPDAYFVERDSVYVLARRADAATGMIGPRIVDSHGSDQTRARNWTTARIEIAEILLPTFLHRGCLRRDIAPDEEIYRSGGVAPYIQGSCMAIRNDLFWSVGGFDERFFLYFEEEAIARKLQSIGKTVALDPTATICHDGGHSTMPFKEWSARQYYRSFAIGYTRYSAASAPRVAVVCTALALFVAAILTPLRRRIGFRADRTFSWYSQSSRGALSGLFNRLVDPSTVPGVHRVWEAVAPGQAVVGSVQYPREVAGTLEDGLGGRR